MDLYLNLLKLFLQTEHYNKYYEYLDLKYIKLNYPDVYKLFKVIESLHEQTSNYNLSDIAIRYAALYPNSNAALDAVLLSRLEAADAEPHNIIFYLESIRTKQYAHKLAERVLQLAEGQPTAAELDEILQQFNTDMQDGTEQVRDADPFVNTDLERIYESVSLTPGLRWRLNSLNKRLGSIRKGDFGFIFARPESGKTTLLASELPFMAEQCTGPLLWFNNEEGSDKVVSRVYQGSLGITTERLWRDRAGNRTLYLNKTGDRVKLILDSTTTKNGAERIIRDYEPSLVVFDQIDKVKGFNDDRNDLELKSIYLWSREIAKEYCPVIGVCQAGASGENKRWLTMNDVDNSKTGKQGEADWILGIGKLHDMGLEKVRYLHLSKNKLTGDPDTDGALRHDKWEVRINPDIARYEDFE